MITISIGTGVVVVIVGFIFKAFSGAASSILADEFKASAPGTAQRIIRIAVRRILAERREEMLETWLAEASEYEGRPLRALRFALWNCLAAAPLLARELRPVAVASSGSTQSSDRVEGARSRVRRLWSWLELSQFLRAMWKTLRDQLKANVRGYADAMRLLSAVVAQSGELMQNVFRIWLTASAAVAAGFGSAVRGLIDLFGPYDYSREWRSVAQLAVKAPLYAFVSALIVAALFYAFEVFLGL